MFLSCTRGYLRLLDVVKSPVTQVPFSDASQHLLYVDSVPFPYNASSVIIDIIVTITAVSVSIGHVLPASVSGPLLVLSLEQKQLSSGPPCQQNSILELPNCTDRYYRVDTSDSFDRHQR